MIVEIDWLREWLGQTEKITAEVLSERLTLIGLEAEVIDNKRLDVKVYPNRGDCLSIYGVAREYSAFYQSNLAKLPDDLLPPSTNFFNLTVAEPAKSHLIGDCLLKIENYTSQPSPPEIISRLKSIGYHPKELAIDLSNLVSFELGLPLHVFDYDKVKNGLAINFAQEGEKVTLLNGQTVTLRKENLIQRLASGQIADLAGIMGGMKSSVTSKTTTLLVQAAVFKPTTIRLSRLAANISTEASYRYERFVDFTTARSSLSRFVELLKRNQRNAQAMFLQSYGPDIQENRKIKINLVNIERILGFALVGKHFQFLKKLGISVEKNCLSIPSWRADLTNDYDLAEELMRFSLISDKISYTLLPKENYLKQRESVYQLADRVKDLLLSVGATETSTDSLIDYSTAKQYYNNPLLIQNPQSRYLNSYRTSLLPGLLKSVSKNQWLGRFVLFEIGQIYTSENFSVLGVIVYGYKEDLIRRFADNLARVLNIRTELKFQKVNPEILSQENINQLNVWYWQIPITDLPVKRLPKSVKIQTSLRLKPVSKFPPIVRDITLLIDKKIKETDISDFFNKQSNVVVCEIIDIYSSEKLGRNHKAVTFKLILQSNRKTLSDTQAEKVISNSLKDLAKRVEFKLR